MDILNRNCIRRVLVLWLLVFISIPVVATSIPEDVVDVSNHFWLRWSVSKKIDPKKTIGGLILTDGNPDQIDQFVKYAKQQYSTGLPIFKELSIDESAMFVDKKLSINSNILKTATTATLTAYGFQIGAELSKFGIDGCIIKPSELLDDIQQENFEKGLQKAGLIVISDELETENDELNPEEIKKPKKQFESYDESSDLQIHHLVASDNWLIDWLNNDILIIDDDQIETLDFFSKRIKANKWYRKLAAKKNLKTDRLVKRKVRNIINREEISWEDIHFELLRESLVIINEGQNIPFPALDEKFVFIGDQQAKGIYTSMSRYAPVQFLSWEQFDEEPERVLTEAANADQIILFYRNLSDLLTIKEMSAQQKKFTILIDNPENAAKLTKYGSVMYLNGSTSIQQDLVGQILFGGIAASGYLPFDVNDQIKRGHSVATIPDYRLSYTLPKNKKTDAEILKKIEPIITASIKEGAFPGCQIAIVKNNALIYEKAFGYFTYDSIFPVQSHHLYDLASITKVAATLQAVMFLQEQGSISLDEKLGTYLPSLANSNKADLTIRNILLHEAGLRPYLPFWKVTLEKDLLSPYVYQTDEDSLTDNKTFGLHYPTPRQKEAVWKEVIDSELRKLGENDSVYNYRYSDLGFMFLQMLVEEVSHQTLDTFLQQNIYQPLGLTNTLFNPLTKFEKENISPTEYDYYFRNAQIWGSVHDQNAQVLGGVAGHAGLFSNAHDLSKLMQMNLNGGKYGGYRFLHDKTLEYFTTKQKEHNRRGLGWDKPDENDGNTSSAASEKTFGHTGFTGTAVWVDPEYDLIFVFLSNRVYPSAENKKLMENNIRIKIQDVIYEAIGTDL